MKEQEIAPPRRGVRRVRELTMKFTKETYNYFLKLRVFRVSDFFSVKSVLPCLKVFAACAKDLRWKTIGIGYFSRQGEGAKVMRKTEKRLQIVVTLISELRGPFDPLLRTCFAPLREISETWLRLRRAGSQG